MQLVCYINSNSLNNEKCSTSVIPSAIGMLIYAYGLGVGYTKSSWELKYHEQFRMHIIS